MAHDARSGLVQMWGPPLLSAALSLVALAIGGWFMVGQRLTSVETGLSGLRDIVDTRLGETDRRVDALAAQIAARLNETRADMREVRRLLMEQRGSQPSGLAESGAGKRRR